MVEISGIPHLLTVKQVAKILGVTEDHVYDLKRTGKLPSIKFGHRTLRFDRKAILAYIEDGRRAARCGS